MHNYNINIAHHPSFFYLLAKRLWWLAILWFVLCITGPSLAVFCFFSAVFAFFAGFFLRLMLLKRGI